MNLTKEQARRVAQALYPALWKSNRIEAIAKAIEFMSDAAQLEDSELNNKSDNSASTKGSAIAEQLREVIRHQKLNVNVVARSIGVSSYTVRTWLEGKYRPSDDNVVKINNFLASFQPEALPPAT